MVDSRLCSCSTTSSVWVTPRALVRLPCSAPNDSTATTITAANGGSGESDQGAVGVTVPKARRAALARNTCAIGVIEGNYL